MSELGTDTSVLLNNFLYQLAELYGYVENAEGVIDVPDLRPLLDQALEDLWAYKDLQNS